MTLGLYRFINHTLNFILGVVTLLLLFRVLFLFFSINQATPFVAWILHLSNFLVAPFVGIVPNLAVSTGVLDVVALIAVVFYSLLGYLLSSLLNELAHPHLIIEEHETVAHYHDIEDNRDKSHHHS